VARSSYLGGSRTCSGVRSRGRHSSSFASASNSCSRRRCYSRDAGERHMPARRWCSAAIDRYSVAPTIGSSHATPFARPGGRSKTQWDAQTGPIKKSWNEGSNALIAFRVAANMHLCPDRVERLTRLTSPGPEVPLWAGAPIRCAGEELAAPLGAALSPPDHLHDIPRISSSPGLGRRRSTSGHHA
jgi:hypothetical protein